MRGGAPLPELPELKLRREKSALISALGHALALSPQDPNLHHWAGVILSSVGNANEALLHMRQAVRLDPGTMLHRTDTATFLFVARQTDAAIGHLKDILAFEPEDETANYYLSRALSVAGRFDEARAAAGRAYLSAGRGRALSMLGYAEARAGNVQAADGVLAKLEALARQRYVPRSMMAAVHVGAGRYAEGAAEIKTALRELDYTLSWAKYDSRWDPIRNRIPALSA